MKNLTLFFLGLLSPAMAQMAPQPLPQVEHLKGQNYLFSWEGVPGRMYFIQTSSSLAANEFDWEFAPDIRVGTGSQIEMGFQANAAHFEFFRLVYNDLSEGEDANLKDNDGDGFTNLEEAIANTNPNSAQSYPGSSGNTGGGNSSGSSGSGTTWNHPWEYKLTYKVEGSTIKEDFINPHNDVGSYDYDREVGYETEIIFENIEGDNKVTFLQLEPDLSSSSSSNGWKSKGVVELSKKNPNWSNDDEQEGTGAVGLLLPIKVGAVGFDGITGYHELKSDDLGTTYSNPQSLDTDNNGVLDQNYAVAYTQGTRPFIAIVLSVEDQDLRGILAGAQITAQGNDKDGRVQGKDGIEIPPTTLTTSEGSSLLVAAAQSTSPWPNTIKFYDRSDENKAFKLDWEIRVGNGDWVQIASTKHQVYLTLNDPLTNLRQETLFYLGSKNADEEDVIAAARDSIYGRFEEKNMFRYNDDVPLTYWKEEEAVCLTTSLFLAGENGNANCQGWAGLFRDALRVQGIPAERYEIFNPGGDILVKKWSFKDTPSGTGLFPYFETAGDLLDLQGIAAQGNPNPPGRFSSHFITESGGNYYDPAYGTPVITGGNINKKYEDAALDGFSISVTEDGKTRAEVIAANVDPLVVSNLKWFLRARPNNTDDTSLSDIRAVIDNEPDQ